MRNHTGAAFFVQRVMIVVMRSSTAVMAMPNTYLFSHNMRKNRPTVCSEPSKNAWNSSIMSPNRERSPPRIEPSVCTVKVLSINVK